MKHFGILGCFCIQFLLAASKEFYISGPANVRDCNFEGYIPGGKVIEVGKITAPTAILAKETISSVIGTVSQTTKLAKQSLKLYAKLSKTFKKASPYLGPAIGMFAAATGIVQTLSEPEPNEILDAVNTAIVDLTTNMNEKLDDMVGYVDGQIITTEKQLIQRDYRSKFNLLLNCVSEPSIDLSNECQRDIYRDIGSILPKFAVYDTKLVGENPSSLSTMEIKKLEAYLVPFRNYADLVLLSLIPLVEVYENDTSANGRGYYKKYSDELKNKAEFFIKYANAAVAAIKKMSDGTNHEGACPGTVDCGSITKVYEGITWFKLNTHDYADCSCVIDDSIKQRCRIRGYIRKDIFDGKGSYKPYTYPTQSTDEALRLFGRQVLTETYAKEFVAKKYKVVEEYWQQELLDFIPEWEKAIKIALPGTKVASDVMLSDEYSPRYKYRLQFEKMYTMLNA